VGDEESRDERTLEVVEHVNRLLGDFGIESALIGAAALAVHGYSRATEDLDLAVATDPFSTLRLVSDRLRSEFGVGVDLITPDPDDPLGGVLTIRGEGFDPVQVVNFLNPLSENINPGPAAVKNAVPGLIEHSSIRVVDIPHLVALKLYAGGYKSRLDVLELLARNPNISIDGLRDVCAPFGLLPALERVLDDRATP
jgi:hypothetical protein